MLHCRDCDADFLYTIGEQQHYTKAGMREGGKPWPPPVRCKVCRERRKVSGSHMTRRDRTIGIGMELRR